MSHRFNDLPGSLDAQMLLRSDRELTMNHGDLKYGDLPKSAICPGTFKPGTFKPGTFKKVFAE